MSENTNIPKVMLKIWAVVVFAGCLLPIICVIAFFAILNGVADKILEILNDFSRAL